MHEAGPRPFPRKVKYIHNILYKERLRETALFIALAVFPHYFLCYCVVRTPRFAAHDENRYLPLG